MKVSDHIAELLVRNGIRTVFSVVGGGAMHLNDSFAHDSALRCIYDHHEQASAIAAESYARFTNEMAAVCVTTGPGGTNAITGVLCAWQDSIPMLVISGQVRTRTTVASTGLDLRQFGEQEHDIVQTVRNITKYAVTVQDPQMIRYHLERAIYEASHGRRGPCWIDVPLDVQGAQIDPDTLPPFVPPQPLLPDEEALAKAARILSASKRPLVLAGSAVRSAGAYEEFRAFCDLYRLPVVAATAIADLLPVGHDDYYGNFGVIGGRCGNFLVRNADCLLVLGCRLAFKHIGFQYESFSPASRKIVVDVDGPELQKPTVSIDCPIHADLRDVLDRLVRSPVPVSPDPLWKTYCDGLREALPIYQERFSHSGQVNPYFFAKALRERCGGDMVTVVGNSCACDCLRQLGTDKEGQRIWGNTDCGTMGYDLPAAIGAAVACGRPVNCVTGDGSIQMNLQELQTIVHNRLPIRIFVHVNGGYQAIVQTHRNFFGRLSGCTPESGVSMPDLSRIADAYRIPYHRCGDHRELEELLPDILSGPPCCICEIVSDATQGIEPKSRSKVLESGEIVSPPLDDLYPFLERGLYEKYADLETFIRMSGGHHDG